MSAYHGNLRAWAKTDSNGRYTFDTVKPLGYREEPRHIHMHVIEPGCASYVVEDMLFADPTLAPKYRELVTKRARSGVGVTTPKRLDRGWLAERDIYLGRNIRNYPGCAGPPN
jgi:hypothetical protein